MPLLNIVCPICTDVFKNSDDVYSTSCGHLFHFSCLNDWQRRGTSCPQCRHYNPTTHKLYLSFDESNETSENQEEMELKLKTSNEKITQLMVQNSEIETNFLNLQKQYTKTEEAKRELEERIREMNDSEENFMHLQGQYTESSELVKELEDRINQLIISNEIKTKELKLKILENESLRAAEGANNTVLSDSILNEKIKILQQKLENLTSELGKEISVSTKLTIEKMKLESYIKHLNTNDTNMAINNKADQGKQNSKRNHKNKKENLEKPILALSRERNDTRNKKELSTPSEQLQQRNRCIIIKAVPRHLIIMPLELIIVNLASKCNMNISAEDVIKVSFLNNTGLESSKSILFAEFKSFHIKELFLAKKNHLNRDAVTRSLHIREFMDEKVLELYKYAKEKLIGSGFECIYCADNKIFGKKRKAVNEAILIRSKDHVNELQVLKNVVKADVDENFYKIL